jgi:GTPase
LPRSSIGSVSTSGRLFSSSSFSYLDFDRASVPASKRVKILYMTQAAVAPPTFVLFTDRAVKLHFSYQRFLENQIRNAFGFMGAPIWTKNRARD